MFHVEQIKKLMIREAFRAYLKDEIPVGCVLTENLKIISSSHNEKFKTKNPIKHAEIIAIENFVSRETNNKNYNSKEIYVTLSPCPMCLGAIYEAKILKINYLLQSKYFPNILLEVDRLNKILNHKIIVEKIVDNRMEELYKKIINNFFVKKRNKMI